VSGIAFAFFTMVTGVAWGTVPAAISLAGFEAPPGEFGQLLEHFGFTALLLAGGLAAALSVASASAVTLRERTWSSWTAYVGFAAAVLLLLSPAFLPLIALPVWVLLVSWRLQSG
jgi:hypothetical protein